MQVLRYLVILTLVLVGPVAAQETGGTGEGTYGGSEGSYGGEGTTSPGLSVANRVATPQQVIMRLNAIPEFCSSSGPILSIAWQNAWNSWLRACPVCPGIRTRAKP
ncbi:hypothetical protein [Pseudophaeobacter sp. C1-32P7]|uniref:hypothetical protein n=1 Tax=Pseudophaeobacter sp. C1-32P7 TaxID=3098142 RepID=UPI0034D3F70F